MPLPIDITKLRLQDSGELIEGLQRSIDPRTSIPNTAKVLKDHRDNFNSILRVLQQFSSQLSSSSSSSSGALGTPAVVQQILTTSTTILSSGVTSPVDRQILVMEITQDATGSRQITWAAEFDPSTTININPDPASITRFTFMFYGVLWHLISYLVV